MALTTINPHRGSIADLLIDGLSYKCIFSTFMVDATTEQIPASTFCSEPYDEFEPGSTVLLFTMAGLLKKGTGGSGQPSNADLILIPPPQDVPLVAQFDVGHTIGADVNFRRCTANRTANVNSIMTAEAFSTGVIAVAWGA